MGRSGFEPAATGLETRNQQLKVELVYRRRYRTRAEAKAAIVEYIELFYNRWRRHSSLDYLSPAEYEELADAA